MKLDEIEKVIKLFEKADISSLEVEDEGIKIKLTKEMTPVIVNSEVTKAVSTTQTKKEDNENADDEKNTIKSPLVGTYHQAPFQDGKPFVQIGSKVHKGDKLCIIEAMKVMNEIKAPRDGTITKIFCEEGSMVEFDQSLFVLGD